jgi:PAS domain S-box-containing protein
MVESRTRQSSISALLILSFVSVGVLMILGGALSLWQLNFIRQRAQYLYQADKPEHAVLRVHSDFLSFQRELRSLSNTHDAARFQEEGNRLLLEFGADVERATQAVQALPPGRQRDAELSSLGTVRTLFAGQLETLMALANSGDWEGVRLRFESRMPMIGELSASLVQDIDDIVEIEKQSGLEDIRRAQLQATLTLVTSSVLALVTAGLLGLWVTRNIAGRLEKLDFAVQALARGEFQHQVTVSGNDEIARLSHAFNAMSSRLHGLHDALRLSEAHFRSLIENARDFILVLDANGTVQYASPSMEREFARHGSLIAKNIVSLVEPDDADVLRTSLALLSGSEVPQESIEFRLRSVDGTLRILDTHASNLLQDQVIAGIVFNVRDITERRRIEGQFRQAQRMETIGTLSGGVAHDFNNLLTIIRGYSAELLKSLSAVPEALLPDQRIDEAAERAAVLTGQLLAFSRRQVLQPKIFDLNALVANLDQMLRRLIGENIDMRTLAGGEGFLVKADAGQIEQVIMNLVVNARDAMPHGGKLTLATTNLDLDQAFVAKRQGMLPGPYVLLAISDTGHGMDAETQAHIFEPFFTTKGLGKGTGLGLSTVYGIVKQSGGYIWVESEPDRGSTFQVFLPRVREPADSLPEAAPPVQDQPQNLDGHETVLVVEDEPQIRELVVMMLTSCGYAVLTADDSSHAATLSKNHAGPIHLLLTDVVMPGISGRELARQLAALRPEMKVLLTSGYTPDSIVQHGVLEPGLYFLQKPFTLNTLSSKVREVLNDTRHLQ